MWNTVIGWGAVATVPLLLAVLGLVIWMSIATYAPARLRIVLTFTTRDDLRLFAQHREPLMPHERDRLQRALGEVDTSVNTFDIDVMEDDENRAYDVTSALYKRAGRAFASNEVAAQADKAHERARARFTLRLERSSPTTVARAWEWWIAIEQIRLILEAVRAVGLQTVKLLVQRAGTPSTNGTVVGAVLGVAVWFTFARMRPDFLGFVGATSALGLYVGVCYAVAEVALEAVDPDVRNAPRSVKLAIAGSFSVVIVMLVLMYEHVIPILPSAASGS